MLTPAPAKTQSFQAILTMLMPAPTKAQSSQTKLKMLTPSPTKTQSFPTKLTLQAGRTYSMLTCKLHRCVASQVISIQTFRKCYGGRWQRGT